MQKEKKSKKRKKKKPWNSKKTWSPIVAALINSHPLTSFHIFSWLFWKKKMNCRSLQLFSLFNSPTPSFLRRTRGKMHSYHRWGQDRGSSSRDFLEYYYYYYYYDYYYYLFCFVASWYKLARRHWIKFLLTEFLYIICT